MKDFILRSLKFGLYFLVLTFSVTFFIKYLQLYEYYLEGNGIYKCIDKSKQKHESKKLLLGDSVGDQLFPIHSTYKSINSVACNKAIGVVGQYILLKNYLDTGNQVDTVFLVYNPESFLNNLDEVYTFHYLLKPFYTPDNKLLFTENVKTQIKKFHIII